MLRCVYIMSFHGSWIKQFALNLSKQSPLFGGGQTALFCSDLHAHSSPLGSFVRSRCSWHPQTNLIRLSRCGLKIQCSFKTVQVLLKHNSVWEPQSGHSGSQPRLPTLVTYLKRPVPTLCLRVQPTGSRVEPLASLCFFNSSSDSNAHLSVEKRTGILKLGGEVSESLQILVIKKGKTAPFLQLR